MGFSNMLNTFKGANNSWAQISCEEGIGYLGPENFVDNRNHTMMISGTSIPTVKFDRSNVSKIEMIAATSEWVKYKIVLSNNKTYIATFLACEAAKQGKQVSTKLLNFETWMAGVIYR